MGYNVYAGRLQTGSSSGVHQWVDKTLVYSSEGDAIEGGPVLTEPELELCENEPGEFRFGVPRSLMGGDGTVYENPLWDAVDFRKTWVSVEEDGDILFMGYVTGVELAFDQTKQVTTTGPLGLMDDRECLVEPKVWYPTCDANGNMPWDGTLSMLSWFNSTIYLPEVYNSSGDNAFFISRCDVAWGKTVDTTSSGGQAMTMWEIVQQYMLEEYGGYFRVVIDKVDEKTVEFRLVYTKDISEKTTQTLEYGKNLLDITVSEDTSGIVNTVSVASTNTTTSGWWIWKKTYTNLVSGTALDEASQKKYGVFRKIVIADAPQTEASCNTLAAQELAKYDHFSVPSVTAKGIDLVDAGAASDRLRFMKKTHVISAPHGVDGWYVCSKAVIPLDRPDEKVYTFGSPPVKLTDSQNQLEAAQKVTSSLTRGLVASANG